MISRASLFNKGIYKSTLRRYLWGSVLYFILLFMVTGMSILLSYSGEHVYLPMINGRQMSILLENEYLLLPILMSIAVPTVAGLMIFRFIHSKKASIFVHSLPVKRTANYISSVLAGLTLMTVPVILNTGVLMIISASGYSRYFSVGDCAVWMLLNLFSLFIMFSCVCFVAAITGNSFAMIALNILLHTFVPLLAAGLSIVSEKFLHGYAGENQLLTRVINNNFPARIMNIVSSWNYEHITAKAYASDFVKFGIIAIVLYAVSAVLYKKRAMETAEDVAGFKCLNPIFKYLITFMGAIAAFSIFSDSIDENEFVFWCIVALVSLVIYFASEMLLKKTFRVWSTYKGYLGFAAAFTVIMCVFSLTSFFGFESNIPAKDRIKSAAVYNYYSEEKPFMASEDIIDRALNLHGKMIVKNQRIREMGETNIHIEYELENGKTIHRRYGISDDELHEIMNSMYKNEEYKKAGEDIFVPMESVYRMGIYRNSTSMEIFDSEMLRELVECIKADVLELDYNQLYSDGFGFTIEIEFVPDEEESKLYRSAERTITQSASGESVRLRYMYKNINPNYKRTIAWIKENGYWDAVKLENEGFIYICRDWDSLPFVSENGRTNEINPDKEAQIIKLDTPEDVAKIVEYAHSAPQQYIKSGEGLAVYQITDTVNMDCSCITSVTQQEIEALFPEKDFSGKFN